MGDVIIGIEEHVIIMTTYSARWKAKPGDDVKVETVRDGETSI